MARQVPYSSQQGRLRQIHEKSPHLNNEEEVWGSDGIIFIVSTRRNAEIRAGICRLAPGPWHKACSSSSKALPPRPLRQPRGWRKTPSRHKTR